MKSELTAMIYDGIVIGGGPAGMFAAITAAKQGSRVLLLEKNDRLGKKLLITGKGRCNVTNNCTADEVLRNVPRNGRFLYSAVNAFTPTDIMAFLENEGCALKTERGNRVFPVSDKSFSVLDALKRSMTKSGVTVKHTAAMIKHTKGARIMANAAAMVNATSRKDQPAFKPMMKKLFFRMVLVSSSKRAI